MQWISNGNLAETCNCITAKLICKVVLHTSLTQPQHDDTWNQVSLFQDSFFAIVDYKSSVLFLLFVFFFQTLIIFLSINTRSNRFSRYCFFNYFHHTNNPQAYLATALKIPLTVFLPTTPIDQNRPRRPHLAFSKSQQCAPFSSSSPSSPPQQRWRYQSIPPPPPSSQAETSTPSWTASPTPIITTLPPPHTQSPRKLTANRTRTLTTRQQKIVLMESVLLTDWGSDSAIGWLSESWRLSTQAGQNLL